MIETREKKHKIILIARNNLEVTGVLSVESFDNQEVILQTDYGLLGIRGSKLNIKNLDLENGEVLVDGDIIDISYLDLSPDKAEKRGFFSRLFK